MPSKKNKPAKPVHQQPQLTPAEPATAPVADLRSSLAGELPRKDISRVPNFEHPVQKKYSLALLLWLAFVLACNIPQPWQLGFYLDDWPVAAECARHGAAFSHERFLHILGIDLSRPALALVRYVLSSMLGESPLSWQGALLLSNIAVALMLWSLFKTLSEGRYSNVHLAVAATWLILPWSAAYRFWCVLLPVNCLLVLFAWLVGWILEQWKRNRGPWLIPAIGYAFCCVSYEAFYLQFIPLLLMGIVQVRSLRTRWGFVICTGAGLALGQGMALLWRFYGPTTPGMVRPPQIRWFSIYRDNLLRLPVELAGSAIEVLPALVLFVILGVGVVLAAMVRMYVKRSRQSLEQAGFGLLACVIGALLGVLVFSVGGRAIAGIGVDSRSLLFCSFWTVIAAGFCSAVVVGALEGRRSVILTQLLFCGLGILLAAAYVSREQDWAAAWQKQRRYLSQAPVAAMQRTEANAKIVYVGPVSIRGAPIFSASYDLNFALPMTYPFLAGKSFIVYNYWAGPMTWDGATLRYPSETVAQNVQTLYLWVPDENRFFRATPPLSINQDRTIVLHLLPMVGAPGAKPQDPVP